MILNFFVVFFIYNKNYTDLDFLLNLVIRWYKVW
jgi:hypothetical protein